MDTFPTAAHHHPTARTVPTAKSCHGPSSAPMSQTHGVLTKDAVWAALRSVIGGNAGQASLEKVSWGLADHRIAN